MRAQIKIESVCSSLILKKRSDFNYIFARHYLPCLPVRSDREL